MNRYTFGTESSQDKFIEVLKEYEEFKLDEINKVKAKNLSSNLWHLTDWAFKENTSFNDLGLFRESLYTNCSTLKIFHDIANGNKHSDVSRPKADIKNTSHHVGDFSNDFCRKDFNTSRLTIELENGKTLDFYTEVEKAIEFWKNYFNTHNF